MTYTDAAYAVFCGLGILSGIAFLAFPIFAVGGFFAKKTFPPARDRLRYGAVISARNEEGVIGALIDSIRDCDYPPELVTVFVIAHNCTDATARIASDHGAVVYEYNNPAEARVGYAYRKIFAHIARDYGTDAFAGYLILDADNLLAPDYLERMNEAFVAGGGEKVVTSFRNAKNFGENYLSALYGILFLAACRLEARGRALCGVSTRVSGTGYLIPAALVRDGWGYVTLTEDWELTADLLIRGGAITYCDDAEFFDEQPTSLSIMFRQRMRWARGHMEVSQAKCPGLFASIFRRGGHPLSRYDTGLQLLPLGCIAVAVALLQVAALALASCFGGDSLAALGQWAVGLAKGFAATYLSLFLSGGLLLWVERRRVGRLRLTVLLPALLLWPFFLLLNVPLDVASLFVKNLQWKPIPHSRQSLSEVTGREVSSTH